MPSAQEGSGDEGDGERTAAMRSIMRSARFRSFAVGPLAADKPAAFREAVVAELVAQLVAQLFVAAASAGGSGLGRPRFERRSAAHSSDTSDVSGRRRWVTSGGDRKVCERPLG